jgi:pimeloyl-ACP methyl ester carboxylesterase
VSVLDELEWQRALHVGHSWGGDLAFRVTAVNPKRLSGMLAIGPLGIVGDEGRHAFEAEMDARTPNEGRARLHELEEKNKTAKLSPDEHDECDAITWPACFADPENVMPRPPMAIREQVFDGLASEVNAGLEEVAAALGKERCHMASWPGPRAHSMGTGRSGQRGTIT